MVQKIYDTISLVLYPVGIFRIWRMNARLWLKCVYAGMGLPVFAIGFGYAGILSFAFFLPQLDRSPVIRADRTIVNSEGNYSATFLKTGAETNGAYELVKVELEPFGGNGWHYHTRFVEEFTVLEGQVKIGDNGKVHLLEKGQSTVANRSQMHFFQNARKEKSLLLVKVTPAAGLEKTLRVAYGLINDGLLKNETAENPWHMALLLSYSESYLEGFPGWFQEPLIESLARIAQWKGEDSSLHKYFK